MKVSGIFTIFTDEDLKVGVIILKVLVVNMDEVHVGVIAINSNLILIE